MLNRDTTALVVIDLQEAFRKAVLDFDSVAKNTVVLLKAARTLQLPVVVTEQYPRGLGSTVPEVEQELAGVKPLEKIVFSAARADGFDLSGRTQALVCGIEAHVCVSQTVHDLLDQDIETHVAVDAVTSRNERNCGIGLAKMEHSGAIITSVETALFELLERAGSDEFKTIQKLVL